MPVRTASRVGRKERMWVRRQSGRPLIMSILCLRTLLFSALTFPCCSLRTSLLSALSALSILCLSVSSISILCRFMTLMMKAPGFVNKATQNAIEIVVTLKSFFFFWKTKRPHELEKFFINSYYIEICFFF